MNKNEFKSPRGKLLKKKLLTGFSFRYPNDETLEILKKSTLPKSSHYNINTRGKSFIDLTIDQLEHVGWMNKNATDRDVFYAKLTFFIKVYDSDSNEFSNEEITDMFINEFGFTPELTEQEHEENKEYIKHMTMEECTYD